MMKTYYTELANGEVEHMQAVNDLSAYKKSQRIARRQRTSIKYVAEFRDTEQDRIVWKKENL